MYHASLYTTLCHLLHNISISYRRPIVMRSRYRIQCYGLLQHLRQVDSFAGHTSESFRGATLESRQQPCRFVNWKCVDDVEVADVFDDSSLAVVVVVATVVSALHNKDIDEHDDDDDNNDEN